MSNRYIFSILGAYNHDPTIFDGLVLPDAPFTSDYPELFKDFPELDKDVLVKNLLIECSQLSLMHTDTNFLKEEISLWSNMHQMDWRQMYETLLYNYNPIWNKDGTYDSTDTTKGETHNVKTLDTENKKTLGTTHTRTPDLTVTVTNSGTDHIDDTSELDDSDIINSVNAFNAGSPTEHDRSHSHNEWDTDRDIRYGKVTTEKTTGSDEMKYTGADKVTNTGNVKDDFRQNQELTTLRREYGNIGVTTTQSMIKEQREIIMNMYQYIIGAFKERFCILIW